jgi:hypothetical protein
MSEHIDPQALRDQLQPELDEARTGGAASSDTRPLDFTAYVRFHDAAEAVDTIGPSTPDAGAEYVAAQHAYTDAAKALVQAAVGRHRIEQTARVFLVLTNNGWILADVQGVGPLDCDEHADTSYCGHDDLAATDIEKDQLQTECELLAQASEAIKLPTLAQLHDLIGRTVQPF